MSNQLLLQYQQIPYFNNDQIEYCKNILNDLRTKYHLKLSKEKTIDINIKTKYVLQNKTDDQKEFILKFLRLIRALNNSLCLCLCYNDQGILKLSTTDYVPYNQNTIRCCLYKDDCKKTYPEYITLAISDQLWDDWFYFPEWHINLDIHGGFKVFYKVDYIGAVLSHLYLKNEFIKELDKVQAFPVDVAGIMYDYLGLPSY